MALVLPVCGFAQTYPNGLIDKTIAVVGNEMISLSQLEQEILYMRMQGMYSDKNMRCEQLERMMDSKLFLMQARIDSLSVNQEMVNSSLEQRMAQIQTNFGGDDEVEKFYGKPIYKLRQEWRQQLEDMTLTQQMQQQIASSIPELTPHDVKKYISETDPEDLPMVPIKYQLSQICIYPDRENANLAVKEKLLSIRERIINGEKFSTLARIYSEDPGSARKGGELGMASKSIFWPAFSDAAMSLKPGVISQIVETPDGFHIIEVLEKKGDMFNARHILIKPSYTDQDRQKAFATLDSLKTEIQNDAVTFELAAKFYSQLKPQDYAAIKDLKEGEISEPVESKDNEGRDGNTVYKIIRVDKIIPAHTASFDNDYSDLLEEARAKEQNAAIDEFIDGKIKTTYIVIDPLFKNCEFSRDGWNKVAKEGTSEK